MEKENARQQLEPKNTPVEKKRPYTAPAIIQQELLETVAVTCVGDFAKAFGGCSLPSS